MTISLVSIRRIAGNFAADMSSGGFKPFFWRLISISAILVFFGADVPYCHAQVAEPGQAVVCEEIQKQINQLLEISKSTSLTEEEKIAQLSKSWTDSLAAMTQFAGKDNDNEKLVTGLITPITAMLASALKSSSRDGAVSQDAKRDLDKVGELVKPYVSIMKMICPSLELPATVPR
ncbi:MAG: hypothetical protein HY912_08470 [Desulfomonile tiedjei]|uniref:Uncharacterized protein n=1 Tax=Desulfomonile tiedjei TaxID=2358 RepID=A0A9D6V0Z2_9BACT|nr:hypothetical protein [Desulfomonile tiedjei]